MCSFTEVVKRVVPFVVAFVAGILGFSLVAQIALEPQKVSTPVPFPSGTGTSGGDFGPGGIGSSRGNTVRRGYGTTPESFDTKRTENYKIISKPQAHYTDEARANNVEGTVRLKVVLLATGNIGSIQVVERLPDGLTEHAIAAARHIRFHPKRINGVPQSVIVTLDYSFNIY